MGCIILAFSLGCVKTCLKVPSICCFCNYGGSSSGDAAPVLLFLVLHSWRHVHSVFLTCIALSAASWIFLLWCYLHSSHHPNLPCLTPCNYLSSILTYVPPHLVGLNYSSKVYPCCPCSSLPAAFSLSARLKLLFSLRRAVLRVSVCSEHSVPSSVSGLEMCVYICDIHIAISVLLLWLLQYHCSIQFFVLSLLCSITYYCAYCHQHYYTHTWIPSISYVPTHASTITSSCSGDRTKFATIAPTFEMAFTSAPSSMSVAKIGAGWFDFAAIRSKVWPSKYPSSASPRTLKFIFALEVASSRSIVRSPQNMAQRTPFMPLSSREASSRLENRKSLRNACKR